MQDLREKLLKAGLVTKDQAERVTASKPAPRPGAPRAAPGSIPKLPPLAGSPEANRQQARAQLELDRTVREKVLAAEVALEPGPVTFHFVTRKQKLRRLDLSAAQAKALEDGLLAVVERPDPDRIEHALVPAAVAEELAGLSSRAVRFLARPGAPVGFQPEVDAGTEPGEPTP